jgi:PTH1 family peptidyl-tRNA hydrolase
MSSQRFIVVGLGNPGKEYARTRHNVGQEAVELLAQRSSNTLKTSKDRALIAEGRINNTAVVLVVPTTYMNDSGISVGAVARRFKVSNVSDIIIVHDELDLEPGIVKLKVGGGLAGHNGLRSISQHLKSDDYARVRIGVGKPRSKDHGADHVLSKIPSAERKILDDAVVRAADAVEAIITDGLSAAMNAFNAK